MGLFGKSKKEKQEEARDQTRRQEQWDQARRQALNPVRQEST